MDIVDKWNQNKNNDETDDEYDKKCHEIYKYVGPQLIEAVEDDNIEKVQKLLNIGINPNLQNFDGETALIIASERGRLNIVKLLLDNKARVNFHGGEGYNALLAASKSGYLDIINLLLDNKAMSIFRTNGKKMQ